MKVKKLTALLLALALVFALTACSAGTGTSGKTETVTYGFINETMGVESYAIGFRIGDDALRDQVVGAL